MQSKGTKKGRAKAGKENKMMTVLREGEKRYLTSWEYNAMRIFAELRKIATENGDKVKPCRYDVTIINRGIMDAKSEYTERLEHLTQVEANHPGENEHRTRAIKAYKEKLAELAEVGDKPLTVPSESWVTFIHDNKHIYYQMDSNPFFEFYYHKTPIAADGTISRDTCLTENSKSWLVDDLLKCGATDTQIKTAAEAIYNELISARDSQILRTGRKTKVPNTYDNGYHYEMVYERERRGKVDF